MSRNEAEEELARLWRELLSGERGSNRQDNPDVLRADDAEAEEGWRQLQVLREITERRLTLVATRAELLGWGFPSGVPAGDPDLLWALEIQIEAAEVALAALRIILADEATP